MQARHLSLRFARWLVSAVLVLTVLLHQDYWNWQNLSWVAGLPSGFAYHLAFCAFVSVLMALMLRLER